MQREKEKESKKESLLTQDNSCQCPLFQLPLFTCSLSKNCKVLYPRSCYNDQDHGKYLHLDKLSKHSFIAFALVNFKCKIYWFCDLALLFSSVLFWEWKNKRKGFFDYSKLTRNQPQVTYILNQRQGNHTTKRGLFDLEISY